MPTTDFGPPEPTPDTTRYEAWLTKQGKPTNGAREDVYKRFGDWGFFDRNPGAGQFVDRAALDQSGHVVRNDESADWYVFLSSPDLDAATALDLVSWLLNAAPAEPSTPGLREPKVKAPTLTKAADGTVTYQGWIHNPQNRMATRITITAGPSGSAKIVPEPANKVP